MSRRRRAAARAPPLAALLAALAACAGSDAQPLELVALDRFGDQASLVAGGGASSIIGYTGAGAGGLPTLRLARHDAATPDRTVFLGDVSFAAGGSITRLAVGDEAAALTVGGSVRIVDLTVPSLPVEDLPALGDASELAVAGRWVLSAAEGGLALVSRDAPSSPVRYRPDGVPTALLAVRGAFLAFTTTGYVAIDPAAVTTFVEVNDPVLANVRDAFADGAGAVVAGPAATIGRARILRLDLEHLVAPAVVRSHELSGGHVALAWDGASTSIVALHGAGDGPDPRSFHEGAVVREGTGAFADEGVPLTFWSQTRQPLAAHAGRLFAPQARGLAFLRIR